MSSLTGYGGCRQIMSRFVPSLKPAPGQELHMSLLPKLPLPEFSPTKLKEQDFSKALEAQTGSTSVGTMRIKI
jgi:hypothetical protein